LLLASLAFLAAGAGFDGADFDFGFGVAGFGRSLLLLGDVDVFFDADGGFLDVGGAEGAEVVGGRWS